MRDFDTIYKIRAIFENTIYGYEFDKLIFFKISLERYYRRLKMLQKLIEFFERETGMTIQEAYNLSPEGQEAIFDKMVDIELEELGDENDENAPISERCALACKWQDIMNGSKIEGI